MERRVFGNICDESKPHSGSCYCRRWLYSAIRGQGCQYAFRTHDVCPGGQCNPRRHLCLRLPFRVHDHPIERVRYCHERRGPVVAWLAAACRGRIILPIVKSETRVKSSRILKLMFSIFQG